MSITIIENEENRKTLYYESIILYHKFNQNHAKISKNNTFLPVFLIKVDKFDKKLPKLLKTNKNCDTMFDGEKRGFSYY